MDLTDFLLARIAEDDEAARAATPGPWEWDRTPRGYWGHQPPDLVTVAKEPPYSDGSVEPLGVVVSSYGYDADGLNVSDEDAEHIARHDPARVLAECDAKRRIVEAEARRRRTKDNVTATSQKAPDDWVDVTWMDENFQPHEEHVSQQEFNERFTEPAPPSETLRLLALPYADHPDYREEWRL
jgi:hypothetical protein